MILLDYRGHKDKNKEKFQDALYKNNSLILFFRIIYK